MKIKVGLFAGKNVVNVWFPGDGERFAVVSFLQIADLLRGTKYTVNDLEFFYIDCE